MPTLAEIESRQRLSAQGESRVLSLGQESGKPLSGGRGGETWVTATGGTTGYTLADWMASISALPTAGTGDAQQLFNSSSGQVLDFRLGTSATPDTSLNAGLKVTRTMGHADDGGASDDGEQLTAILGAAVGVTAMVGQPVGVVGIAKHSGTTSGTGRRPDAVGIYGIGDITGSGTGVGIGAFFQGRREESTGKLTGVEIQTANYGGAALTYSSTGFSSGGIWLNANGDADSAAGIMIANPFGFQFEVGIAFVGQVAGGKTGGISAAAIRDDSTATKSYDIRGTHNIAIDATGATLSGGVLYAPNNVVILRAKNAAGDSDDALLSYNSSDVLVIGSTDTNNIFMSQTVQMQEAKDLQLGTTTGTKIGTGTTQKLSFWNATPVVQPAAVADASGGATIDAEARTALNALLARMRTVGMIAT